MSTFTVLHTADWHNDAQTREFVEPAIEYLVSKAEEIRPDYVVFAGDAYIHRGTVRPHSLAFNRSAFSRLADAAKDGFLAISGNHDQEFRFDLVDAMAATISDVRTSDGTLFDGKVELATRGPRVAVFPVTEAGISFVLVPTPNKFWLHALESSGLIDLEAEGGAGRIIEDAIQGMILEELAAGRRPIVVYHGTAAGSRLSNEQVMHAGIDIPISTAAFRGAAAGLLGHVHHPQEIAGSVSAPPLFYPGAIAPGTWNDAKLEPCAYLHTFEGDGLEVRLIKTERVMIPVSSQMIEIEIPAAAWADRAVEEVIVEAISSSPAGRGDRVRLAIEAPSPVLSMVTDARLADLCERMGLAKLTALRAPSDDREVRFDAERTVDLVEAFGRWIDLRGGDLSDGEKDELMGLAREIEKEVVDEHLEADYEFSPEKLRVENWYQHGSAEIDFSEVGPLVAVCGPNTAGKSNLLRAIPFALYKKIFAGDVLSDVVRKGEGRCEVELTFSSGGRRFRVTRKIRVSPSGAKAEIYLESQVDDGLGPRWVPLAEGDARKTEAEIARLVGPLDLFLATSYAGQSDVDALLDLGPAEFRDLLQTVLQRDFASRVEIARRRSRAAEKSAERLAAKREVYHEERRDEDDLARRIRQGRAVVSELEAAEAADRGREVLDEELAEAREVVERRIADLERVRAKNDEANRLEGEVARLEDDLRVAQAKAERARAIRVDLMSQDAPDVEVESARLAKADEELAEAEREFEASAGGEAADAAAGMVRDLEISLAAREAKVKRLEIEIEEKKSFVSVLDGVPCSGRPFIPEGQTVPIDGSSCHYLAIARDARDRLPDLVREKDAEAALVVQARRSLSEAKIELDRIVSSRETFRRRLRSILESARAERDVRFRAVAEARQKIESIKAAGKMAEELEAEAGKAPAIAAALEKAMRERGEAVAAAAGFVAVREALDGARRRSSEIEGKIRDYESERESRAKVIAESTARIDRLEEELAASRRASENIAEIDKATVDLERIIRIAAVYEMAVGRDGIPQLLIERYAIPQLQDLTNAFLAETEFRVSVSPERDLSSGEVRSGVFVSFMDSRGTHPMSSASGFQRDKLGAGLRHALAGMHANSTGTRVWISIQDEGFGSYDEANLEAAAETLRRVAADRRWLFFVTHVGGLPDVADTRIDVTPGPGSSKIAIVQKGAVS